MSAPISNPQKVIFPGEGIAKGELIEYYRRIAPRILPYLRGRPLSLERFPSGIGARGFFQQHAPEHFPDWIKTVTVPKEGGTVRHVICDDERTLVYLANLAMVTPHAWLSRVGRLENPDQLVFDLDPSGAVFPEVKAAAQSLRSLLDAQRRRAFVKTTGKTGLHVAVPLDRKQEFGAVRAFARAVAEELVKNGPDRWTLEQRKDKRHGRVFIDTNRNAYGQTVAPAYAVRARAGAPISMPLAWEELDRPDLRPDEWTIRNAFETLDARKDPWHDFFR
ncbi:MAG: non-homologous end-joining DNA ligase [Acidobacteriota bacterium]